MIAKKSRLQHGSVIAVCSYGFLFYSLLFPNTGVGIIDTSIFGSYENQITFSLIACILLLLNCFMTFDIQRRWNDADSLLLIFLLIFVLAIGMQSFRPGPIYYNIIVANIITCTTFCSLIVWLKAQTQLLRYYPVILYAMLIFYAINICKVLYIPGKYQGYTYLFHGVKRLSLIFDNPNHLGNLLAFGVVYCFGAVVLAERRWSILALWILLVILMLGLIQTYSRGAWLGGILGIVTAAAYLLRRIPLTRLVSALTLLILITMFSFVVTPGGYAQVFHRATHIQPSHDASVGNRLEIWKSALKMTRDHWLIGVGIGQFGEVLEKGYKPTKLSNNAYASAMNNYLTLAAEAGIPTALLYLFCLGFACVLASKRLPRAGITAGSSIGMLCGVYSMLVFSCTTYTLGRVYAIVLVWSVLGYLVAAPLQDKPEMQCVRQNTES